MKTSLKAFWVMCCSSLFALGYCCSPGLANPPHWNDAILKMQDRPYFQFENNEKQACKLVFPQNYSVGDLKICHDLERQRKDDRLISAKGHIKLEPLKYVVFTPSSRFFADLSVCRTIHPENIDGLKLKMVSYDDKEDTLCDQALSNSKLFCNLLFLDMDRSDITDKGAAFAGSLTKLQKLTASGTSLNGNCFRAFRSLQQLRYLKMNDCSLLDKNLQFLHLIPRLQYLNLSRTNVGKKGLEFVSTCPNLLSLEIRDNPNVTDDCMPLLCKLRSLVCLDLMGTAVTPAGVLNLRSLKLKQLVVPIDFTDTQMSLIKKVFSNTSILKASGQKLQKGKVTDNVKQLFAPMH